MNPAVKSEKARGQWNAGARWGWRFLLTRTKKNWWSERKVFVWSITKSAPGRIFSVTTALSREFHRTQARYKISSSVFASAAVYKVNFRVSEITPKRAGKAKASFARGSRKQCPIIFFRKGPRYFLRVYLLMYRNSWSVHKLFRNIVTIKINRAASAMRLRRN